MVFTYRKLLSAVAVVVLEASAARADNSTELQEVTGEVATSNAAGIALSSKPTWLLLADTNVSSVDVAKPTGSIGLERATPFTNLRVQLRQNLADSSVESNSSDHYEFGRALLNPALANVAVSLRFFRWVSVWVAYDSKVKYAGDVEKRRTLAEFCTGVSSADTADCHTRTSHGPYAAVDVAIATFTLKDSAGAIRASGRGTPTRASVGWAFRLEGVLPTTLAGSRVIGLTAYGGPTLRLVGGDLSATGRAEIFGNASSAYLGGELGVECRLSNLNVTGELTGIWPGTSFDVRVPGLTGLQASIALSFVLPWTVLGAPAQESNTDAAAKRNPALK